MWCNNDEGDQTTQAGVPANRKRLSLGTDAAKCPRKHSASSSFENSCFEGSSVDNAGGSGAPKREFRSPPPQKTDIDRECPFAPTATATTEVVKAPPPASTRSGSPPNANADLPSETSEMAPSQYGYRCCNVRVSSSFQCSGDAWAARCHPQSRVTTSENVTVSRCEEQFTPSTVHADGTTSSEGEGDGGIDTVDASTSYQNSSPAVDEEVGISGDESPSPAPFTAFLARSVHSRRRTVLRQQDRGLTEAERMAFRERMAEDAIVVEGVPLRDQREDGDERTARERDEQIRSCRNDRRRQLAWGVLAIATIVAIAVAVTLAIVLSSQSSDRQDEEEFTMWDGGWLPSFPPILPPHSERYKSIRAALLAAGAVPSFDHLDEASSPQHNAAIWLADKDDMQIDSNHRDTQHLVQRFAVATFFFSTGGEGGNNAGGSWKERIGFLSSSHECEWNEEITNDEEGMFGANFTHRGVLCDNDTASVIGLVLPHNNLNGKLPEELGLLKDIILLALHGNMLTSTLPAAMGALENLRALVLKENRLTGSIPESLSKLIGLEALYLDVNEFTGIIPEWIGRLSDLRWLYLLRNRLRGTLPASINNLTNLQGLSLAENSMLFGTLPFISNSLPELLGLWLAGNYFTGTIPDALSTYTKLRDVRLGRNFLNGTIPSRLGNLQSLEGLGLSVNRISGFFPLELTNISSLRELHLGDIWMNGTLPPEVGNFTSLNVLDLTNDFLSGMVPDEMGNLQSIEEISLAGNYFTGTLPLSFAQLTNLYTLDLAKNSFTGDLNFLCRDPKIPVLRADCHSEDPEVRCDCCTMCCDDNNWGGPAHGCFHN